MRHGLAGWAMAFALCAVFGAGPATADDGPFFRGRKISIYVGFGPGGSASLYAEALSRHMGRFLPGAPTFVVQHMPGAGGLTVANYIANTAPRDGTAFAISGRTIGIEPLMGNANAKFDGRKLNWLGTANVETTTCLAWQTSPVKTLQDAMAHELVIGGTGAEATDVIFPKAINALVGTKFKIVMGYPGSTEMDLAMERGELQGNCGLGWTIVKNRRPGWLEQKKISLLFQMALEKHPDLPDVPLILDYAKSDADRQALEFLFAPQKMGRPFFAPPDVPPARLQELREAFARTLVDPDFLADATKAGLEVQLVDGRTVQELIAHLYQASPALLARIKQIADHP